MKKKPILVCSLAVIGVFLLAGSFIGFVIHKRYGRFPIYRVDGDSFHWYRTLHTRRDISEIVRALNEFRHHYGKLPFNSPEREDQFSITLGHELNGVRPGVINNNVEGIVFWQVRAGDQRDGWENEYHYYFDHDHDGILFLDGHSIEASFAVWSAGRNEVNEFGSGDDIRSW